MRKKLTQVRWRGEPSVTVTKIDAAKRQAEIAIELFFGDGDIVSLQSLTENAREILAQLGRGAGLPSPLEAKMSELQAIHGKDFKSRLAVPRDFAKHSGANDSQERCDYYPSHIQSMLLDALGQYQKLAGGLTPRMEAFVLWTRGTRVEDFKGTPMHAAALEAREQIGGRKKRNFYLAYLKFAAKTKA